MDLRACPASQSTTTQDKTRRVPLALALAGRVQTSTEEPRGVRMVLAGRSSNLQNDVIVWAQMVALSLPHQVVRACAAA